MKKMIYMISLLVLIALDINAQTYGAGVRIEDLYWYNNPLHEIIPGSGVLTVEWVCTTKAILYFGDEEIEPSPEHSYVWYKNPSGTWVVAGTNYLITPDGNPGQYYQVKVRISGPGFNVTSQPFTIGLSGDVQLLEVKAKLQNGTSLSNSFTYFQNFTDPQWRPGRFDVGTQKNVLNLTQNENSLIRINPYDLPSYNQKFNRWNSSDQYINYDEFYIDNSFTLLNGNFKQRVKNVIIQTNSENSVLQGPLVGFKDPWLMEFVGANLGKQNKGDQATFKYYNLIDFSVTGFDDYKGVFLNQPIVSGQPYYSVKVNSPQDINLGGLLGTRRFYFRGWNYDENKVTLQTPLANESAVVFKISDAELSADFKGQGLSNNQNAYTNNSQRKFVRTTGDEALHNVYSSMGHVWYERSTDGGSTWSLANIGNYLDNGEGKLPSMDESGASVYAWDRSVLIAYQERNGNNYRIKLKRFEDGIQTDEEIVYSVVQSYDINANPVIAFSHSTTLDDKFIVIFQTNQGLYYRFGYIEGGQIKWPLLEPPPEGIVNGTDQNSINPTIASAKNVAGTGFFHLVWQQNNQIYYKKMRWLNDEIIDDPAPSNISSNTGFSQHYNPSIIEMPNSTARVCWVGYRMVYPEKVPQYKVLFKSPQNPGSYWQFGNNVSSPNINKKSDNTYYAFGWSENQSTLKFADNTLSSVRTISGVTGQNIQINNGTSTDNMFGMAFEHNSGVPYYFKRSTNLTSFYNPQKITASSFSSGREGAISFDSAAFYFAFGDINVDGQTIEFVEVPDSIPINNLSDLNESLVTLPFNVTNNSYFEYGVQYGITDSLSAAQAMVYDRFINFKIILQDENTGEVLGEYDNVTFNEENIYQYNNISYLVNTQGIGNRTVRLKLTINKNFNSDYSLSQIYSDENVLNKTKTQEISYRGNENITSYDLYQNYPNPFNPATTLSFQIPEDGVVSLKVYDILGKEIKTLINEQKSKGRYEINFDASDLASSVYIYRMQVNDYVSSKKMILIK